MNKPNPEKTIRNLASGWLAEVRAIRSDCAKRLAVAERLEAAAFDLEAAADRLPDGQDEANKAEEAR